MSTKRKILNILISAWLVLFSAAGYLTSSIISAQPAQAADAAGWNAGRIIDDGKFTNVNTMTESQIYFFMVGKVPTCDTNHPSGMAGESPPWTCLKDYWENGTSSAHIIWQAAQDYGINPQVLLVTLEKETGLVTDTWPYSWQYRTAMGFACPDNGTCDPAFYGFTNQVRQAARHFRNFFDNNPNWYVPYTTGTHFIQYNPNSGCGGTNVNIQTRGTAALYSYTPYQPNAAALANLYGTGDSCSAYGNRNFWRTFVDWFGSTYDPAYSWSFVSQSADKDLTTIKYGDTINVSVRALNTGASTWYPDSANQVDVVTDRPLTRTSAFYDTSWINSVTPTKLAEPSVAPGQIGTFYFKLKAPNQTGTFREYFSLVAQGAAFFNDDVGQFFQMNVSNPYNWSFNSQAAYTDNSKSTPVDLNNLSPGQTAWLVVKANNTGSATWQQGGANQVDLATDRNAGRASRFATNAWINSATPAAMNEVSVAPGQVATFEFPIQVPAGGGTWREYFSPVAQGITFFNNDVGQFFPLTVKQDYRWSFNTQGAYTDSSKTTTVNLSNMSPGQTAWLVVKANNIGASTWYKTGNYQVDLATDRTAGRVSRFATNAWLQNNTPVALSENSVAPGGVGTFEFPIQIPSGSGTWREYFNPLAQNITWFNNDVGQFFPITVP